MCSQFLSFAVSCSASWRGVCRGSCPHDSSYPGPGTAEGSSGRSRREGKEAGQPPREVYWHRGSLTFRGTRSWLHPAGPRPWEAKAWGLAAAREAPPRQVPQGHTRPGGCKPQVQFESGRSFSSNPFYTVKTAKLSPRRPLLIGRQTDDKPNKRAS